MTYEQELYREVEKLSEKNNEWDTGSLMMYYQYSIRVIEICGGLFTPQIIYKVMLELIDIEIPNI